MVRKLFTRSDKQDPKKTITFLEKDFEKKFLSKMNFKKDIKEYSPKRVDFEIMYNILEAGFSSHNILNIQNYEIVLIEEKQKKVDIALACEQEMWIAQASYIIVLIAQTSRMEFHFPKSAREYTIMNISCFAQAMIDTANLYDLGACLVVSIDKEKVGKIIGANPDDIAGLVTVGFPINDLKKKVRAEMVSKVSFENLGDHDRKILDTPFDTKHFKLFE